MLSTQEIKEIQALLERLGITGGGGGVTDGDKGDIVVSGSGATWTIDNSAVSNANMANMADQRIKGNVSGGSAAPSDLTASQVKTLLALASTDISDFTEAAQDVVGALVADSATIDATYNDAGNVESLAVIDNTSIQKVEVCKNSGAVVSTRKQLNFIEGSNVTLTVADDGIQTGITIASTGGSSGSVYTLPVDTAGATTFTDGQTIYWGGLSATSVSSTAGFAPVYIPTSGTITKIYLWSRAITVAGSGESWSAYLRYNGTTDALIQSTSVAGAIRTWVNNGLSIAVTEGEYLEIKMINPAWATNPQGVAFGGIVYITT